MSILSIRKQQLIDAGFKEITGLDCTAFTKYFGDDTSWYGYCSVNMEDGEDEFFFYEEKQLFNSNDFPECSGGFISYDKFTEIINQEMKAPVYEPPIVYPKHLIVNKFFWRQVVRPITNVTSTPTTLDRTHLGALIDVRNNPDEFCTKARNEGRVVYGGINPSDFMPSLKQAIEAIEEFGYCTVID